MNAPRYLSQNDAIMWTVEADPLLRSTILAIVELDHEPDWDALCARVCLAITNVPALRERVVSVPAHPSSFRWVPEPDVDLAYHLRRLVAPAPGGEGELLDLARTIAASGFDRARPLWEFTLVEGLANGRAALVMKTHHVVTDGIGAVQLALQLFDLTAEASDHPSPDAGHPSDDAVHVPSGAELFRDALVHDVVDAASVVRRALPAVLPTVLRVLRDPLHAAVETAETLASVGRTIAPVSSTLSTVMVDRHMASCFGTIDVSLDAMRAAASVAGGTVNDVFLGAITGGLRRYHDQFGVDVEELRVAMPVSIRVSDDPAGGNHVSVLRFKVPVGVDEPEERVRRLHEIGRHIRAERSLPHTETIAGGLNLVPRGVIGSMLKKVDFLASNVPGMPVPMWLCGVGVERFIPFGPTAGAAVNVTMMSYQRRCSIGVNMDTAAVVDADAFMACLRDGFDEVFAIAPG